MFALLALSVVLAAPPDTFEVQLWPDNTSWWTGFVQHDRMNGTYGRSDNVIKLEYLYTYTIEDKVRSGWMKFNTAAIPDQATIVSASLRYLVMYFEMTVYFKSSCLTIDPARADPEALFDAIAEGAECSHRAIGRVYDTTDLNATGVAHVQNTLGQDWVAFGLCGTNFSGILSRKAWIAGWNMTPPGDRPQLAVRYVLPQAVEETESERVRREKAGATVVRGKLWLAPALGYSQRSDSPLALLDATGRRVMELHASANDVSRLAPGVYFLRQASGITRVLLVK